MDRSFHGGFICGLPQTFFDDALLWQPCSPLQRRFSNTRGNNNVVLPSWSWAGWEGEIQISRWASRWDDLSLAFHNDLVIWKLTYTVEWSYGESRETRRRVEVSSHRYRGCLTDRSIPLPPGWSRKPAAAEVIHEGGTSSRTENNDLAKYAHFVHNRFPGINFPCPIPLPKRHQQDRSHTSPQFLFGRTRRGYFKEDRTPNYEDPILRDLRSHEFSTIIYLCDKSGKWAGMV